MGSRLGKEICSGQGQREYGLCESGAKTTENAGGAGDDEYLGGVMKEDAKLGIVGVVFSSFGCSDMACKSLRG